MSIWKIPFNLQALNKRSENTMLTFLGVEFIAFDDNSMTAKMPVNQYTRQPLGIMHGGASCVLAESVGSTAANYCVDFPAQYCVGLDINTNHVRSIREGFVFGTAKPFHLGKSTQVWGIEIKNEKQQLISVSRLTLAVLTK